MNTSQFMDKQILGLSASATLSQSQPSTDGASREVFDLMNPQEDNHHTTRGDGGGGGMIKKEEILPSYDFQPIRGTSSSSANAATGFSGSGSAFSSSSWPSIDSKIASSILRSAGILEADELTKVSQEKHMSAYDAATVTEIDRTVKKHADNLLHALEGLNSRLSQLESRTHHLDNTVDELKVTIGSNNGSTDGKLRQLEIIIREVQDGVRVLRDKQEIMETKLHHSNAQASEAQHKQPEISNPGVSEVQPQVSQAQQLVQQPYQLPITSPQTSMLPGLPTPNAPPPPSQHNPPQFTPQSPQPQMPQPQMPQSQMPSVPPLPREAYFPPAQAMETMHQQYQPPVGQTQQPPPPHYQSAPQLPQYHQPPQPQSHVNPSVQLQPPIPQHPEESAPYLPQQTYPSSIRQPAPFSQPPSGPIQQFGPNMYELPSSKPNLRPSFSPGYSSAMGPSFSDPSPYGSPSRHSNSVMKPPSYSSGAASSGASGNYPRLPTAQVLPQALPTTSASGTGSGTRVAIDDVVEKVATMGFSRDQVRATVRKLTENGQSVDLNVVLDKLMNDGEVQLQKGWYGR